MAKIVLATRNAGKVRELTRMLASHDVEVLSMDSFPDVPDIPETGDTFEENALLKACEVSRLTGLVAVADDSGLEVDALDGAPGVYSARYAGEDATDEKNVEKLLQALSSVPESERTARFVCVMAACSPDGEQITARGEWNGTIIDSPRGHNGFGYDPIFVDPELEQTNAELDPDVKNARSHRGKALAKLLANWADFWDRAHSAT